MEEKALLFQITHGVANGGRGHAESEPPGKRSGTGRLGSLDVAANHCFEHATLASRKLLRCHNSKASNDFGRVSSRLPVHPAAASRAESAPIVPLHPAFPIQL